MYFFIDPANLTSQTIDDAYGPLSTDATNIYNTTSRFQLTDEAKAFACQNGSMIVQQSEDDDSLVNLVIKPLNNAPGIPLDVEYFIYRGILKNSLINDGGTNCTIQEYSATTSNDLITRMRLDPLTNDYACEQIGYSNDVDGLTLLDSFFTENNPIVGPVQINAVTVIEGEWIGTFATTHRIGFEVVLKSDFNDFNIDFLRAANHQINVTGLTGFQQRLKREEILKFIDPAAFFGMHHSETVDYYVDGATNDTETTTENATGTNSNRFIYTQLLDNFHTRNNVYVDIRSEKGYSYNFYQNYKVSNTDSNNIQIRTQAGNTPLNAQEYHTNQWPILILTATHTSGNENSLKLRLRIDDNTKPILYTKTNLNKDRGGNNTRVSSRYFKTTNLIDNGNNPDHTTWTNTFRVLFPNTQHGAGGNSNRDYISNYVRLHYYRTKHNATNTNAGVLENVHYYDSAFCSIDISNFSLPDNSAVGYIESTNPIYVREPLHHDANHPDYDANYNMEGTGNFELNMINGVYWGDNRVLMYARIEYENTAKVSGKEYLNTYDQQLASFTSNNKYTPLANDRLKFLCREYDITGNSNNTNIPSINFFRSNDLADSGKNHKENCMFLGLTIDEMTSIKADTQLSDNHQRFIHLEPLAGNPQQDNNNHRYFAYTVRLQGFDTNQHADIVTPQHNSNNIVVYSRDNQFFSSYAFSEDEAVTTGQNRIEFHIYHDGVIKITDNIDMALVHDIQNIFYRYRATNNGAFTDVCNLDLVLSSKMKRNPGSFGVITNMHNAPHNFPMDPFIRYQTPTVHPGVDAEDSYRNNAFDIATTPRQARPANVPPVPASTFGIRKYLYQGKKVFLVNFVTANVNNAALGINITYENTLRHYAKPSLAAAIIGALIDINHNITCQGFAYEDGSSYPSAEHVNGEAADTDYGTTQENVDYIQALHRFGFNLFRIGNTTHAISNNIYNNAAFAANRTNIFQRDGAGSTLHQTHLHSTSVELNDGNKTI